MISAEEMVERIGRRFGLHPGFRALHARGVICSGSFEPTPEAARLTTAAHMQEGRTPVVARLSNGGGDPGEPDRAPDVRGLAVRFEPAGGDATDIVAQSAPRFPVKTPEQFIALVEASKREPAMLLRLPLFLLRNPGVIGPLKENAAALRAPASYADVSYYAVHAFEWSGAAGSRWVRYRWDPVGAGEGRPPEAAPPDYLTREVAERLPGDTIRFRLVLQLAGPGDDPHDPTSSWDGAEEVTAGELTLDAVATDRDPIIFDPMRLPEGIGPSEDPILRFRPRAYAVSYDQRTGTSHERPDWAQ